MTIQVLGWLLVLVAIPAGALYFIVDHDKHPVTVAITFGVAPIALLWGAFTVYCGRQLKALRSYSLVMVSVVVMLIAGLLVCPLLALPGIWPMIVMLDSGVKAHFGAASALR